MHDRAKNSCYQVKFNPGTFQDVFQFAETEQQSRGIHNELHESYIIISTNSVNKGLERHPGSDKSLLFIVLRLARHHAGPPVCHFELAYTLFAAYGDLIARCLVCLFAVYIQLT
jgi:hypothetical protein